MKNLPSYLIVLVGYGLLLLAVSLVSCEKEPSVPVLDLEVAQAAYGDPDTNIYTNKALGNFSQLNNCEGFTLKRTQLIYGSINVVWQQNSTPNYYLSWSCNSDCTQITNFNGTVESIQPTPLYEYGYRTTYVNLQGAIWIKDYQVNPPAANEYVVTFSDMHNFDNDAALNSCIPGIYASVNGLTTQTNVTAFNQLVQAVEWYYSGELIATTPKLGISASGINEDFGYEFNYDCPNSLLVEASSANVFNGTCDCPYELTLKVLISSTWYEVTKNICLVVQGVPTCN